MSTNKINHVYFRRLLLVGSFAIIGTLGAVIFGGKPFVAKASSGAPECYRTLSQGNPLAGGEETQEQETWCYKELDQPEGARLVYQVDEAGRTRPELTIRINADGTLTHASLQNGKLTVHNLLGSDDFNPIGAPLTPPEGAERVSVPISPTSADSPDEALKVFEQEHGEDPMTPAKVQAGQFTVSVAEDALPWRGYWFPYSTARMHRGGESVMAKYDKFISRRTGNASPGAQAWEKRRHSHGFAWSGHCNGWAAASIMTKEPKKPLTDPFSGVTFTVSDLKGLNVERNYCPKIVFYGTRNYGRPNNNPRDILAQTFHNSLSYFIGGLKKPVLVDLMAGRPIQNSVISGYTMNIKKTGPNRYYVETTATVHLYDEKDSNEPGVARIAKRVYKYYLTTNNEGYVRSGSWVSANPDFVWVPLSTGECKDRNQIVDQFWIDEIYRVSK